MCGLVYLAGLGEKRDKAESSLSKLIHRGPDSYKLKKVNDKWLGFTRLAIMDQSSLGEQPFRKNSTSYLCNGEIYNFSDLKKSYDKFSYESKSDCEVLIPLYESGGIEEVLRKIDGEFAFVIYGHNTDRVEAARDPMGIRPLFYGYSKTNRKICFASEAKALVDSCDEIKPFPPGFYFKNNEFKKYLDLSKVEKYLDLSHEDIYGGIREKLVAGVEKRMTADCEIGYLLSGGLDSSLVCSIAAKLAKKRGEKPIRTFAIGMSEDAIDLKYAKEVAEYIGSDHTEVIINKEDVLSSVEDVIKSLESWDITTIRASVGMYLVCKYIKEKTDIKVLMTGEVSDEIFGYKYTDYAPSAEAFQKEASKRVKELYLYDVLRADRCISAHSLEARVPFSDTEFVKFVMAINPQTKMNTYGHGKYLLRKAFEGDYLPDSILYREKAAFSDAVGHSLVEYIKEYAESLYTDFEYHQKKNSYSHGQPFTKESLMFREIFESFYSKYAYLIKDFWMPNKEWENCDVLDPSARVLPNYGLSGS